MEHQRSDAEKLDEVMLPGFRFHPTDEELVGFYLKRKIQQRPLSIELIKQLDIYKYDPWDLPKMAATGEKEWYFYCPRDRKYRNSARPNRVTGAGFWKATGTDRPIYSSEGSKCVGLKKSLVFYKGRAAKGVKTDWMMHEFRLPSLAGDSAPTNRCIEKTTITPNEAWAICRIFKKANSTGQRAFSQSWVSPAMPDYSIKMSPTNKASVHPMSPNFGDTQPSSSSIFSIFDDPSGKSLNLQTLASKHCYHLPNISSVGLPTSATFSPPHQKCCAAGLSSLFLEAQSSSLNLGDFGRVSGSRDLGGPFHGDQCKGFSIAFRPVHELQGNGVNCEAREEETASEWARHSAIIYSDNYLAGTVRSVGFPLINWDSLPCPTEMSTTDY